MKYKNARQIEPMTSDEFSPIMGMMASTLVSISEK